MDRQEYKLLDSFTELETHYIELESDPILLFLSQTKAKLIDAIINGVPEFPSY